MKRLYIIITLASLFTLQACQNFLDVKPKNVKVVSTIEDYRDILASYMRLLKTVDPDQQPVLGDEFNYPLFDVAEAFSVYTGEARLLNSNPALFDPNLGRYTKEAVNRCTWMLPNQKAWERYYSFLGPINMIIGGLEEVGGDNENLRNYVKGEALVWRAFAYFKLLQYYAPYKNDKYGVPVYLKPYEDPASAMPERKSQKEVYAQILKDCSEAGALLEMTPTVSWNCAYNADFLNAMMASVYTYKAMSAAKEEGDWKKAEQHAGAVTAYRKLSNDAENLRAMFNCDPKLGGVKAFTNDEFTLRIVDGSNGNLLAFKQAYGNEVFIPLFTTVDQTADLDFYDRYKDDDIRKGVYFEENAMDGTIENDKYNLFTPDFESFTVNGGVLMPFRLAEMYLIQAEALVRQGKDGEARTVLDEFKSGRYADVAASYTEAELLDEILKERELEFFHENDFRWLDMKRLGIRVERVINGTAYVLEPDDFRYCLPIPKDEMKNNLKMVQTPGWDKVYF